MRSVKIAVVLAVLAALAAIGLQRAGAAQNAAPPAAANLRIVSPENGARISTSFVDVRYQLTNPATDASPTPTFQLQLDGGDPVRTASTEFTFTGLAPGPHTITVALPQGPAPGAPRSGITQPHLQQAALQQDTAPKSPDGLPSTGSALPLLSVIGFGVLLGGIASALKTR
jgi:hypothetical protein